MGCSANRTDFPDGPMQPCLTTETVDSYYREMADHRINRVAWMNSYDFLTGVGCDLRPILRPILALHLPPKMELSEQADHRQRHTIRVP